mgnify:CR=1 FL=1
MNVSKRDEKRIGGIFTEAICYGEDFLANSSKHETSSVVNTVYFAMVDFEHAYHVP